MYFYSLWVFSIKASNKKLKLRKLKQEQAQKQNSAPEVDTTKAVVTPDANKFRDVLSKTVSNSSIISVIKTAKNIIEIDSLGRIAQVTLLEEKYKMTKVVK